MIGNGTSVWAGKVSWRVVIAMLLSAIAMTATAQDTRQVTEPKIPASCVQLAAQLRAVSDKLAEEDEGKL